MKKLYILCISFIFFTEAISTKNTNNTKKDTSSFKLYITPEWQELDDGIRTQNPSEKWIYTGMFVFKKRSKQPYSLKKFEFSWQGKNLTALSGSLFTKKPGKPLQPIDEYLVADSEWDADHQCLIFNFNEPLNLQATTVLCLVLTIPEKDLKTLEAGTLVVMPTDLPQQLSYTTTQEHLRLSHLPIKNNQRTYRFLRRA